MVFKSDVVSITTDAMDFVQPIGSLKKTTGRQMKIVGTRAFFDSATGEFKRIEEFELDRKNLINLANKLVEWVVDYEEELDKPTRMKTLKNTLKEKLYAVADNQQYADQEEPE